MLTFDLVIVRPLQPSVTVTLKKQTLPLFSRTALNTWFLSLWSAPPDPRHLANMEITTIHGADLSMWGLPAGILLRDRIKKLRGLFLQELYTATTSDAASAAAINFRKEIDLWILDMQNYTMKCPGYNRSQRKLNLLLVKRRTRNLTYKDAQTWRRYLNWEEPWNSFTTLRIWVLIEYFDVISLFYRLSLNKVWKNYAFCLNKKQKVSLKIQKNYIYKISNL